MTEGILGVIACPMLEDELIYALSRDQEDKRVIVLDTPHCGSLRRKMDLKGVKYEVMDEWDFMNTDAGIDRSAYNIVIRMKSLALHSEPVVLKQMLEDDLVMLQGRVDAVALYYGMCGNAMWDVSKWAEGHVSYPVTVFRDSTGRVCDDCVGVTVGGLDGYRRLLKEFTGVMLFTPAVATNWLDFLSASDIARGVDLMGPGDRKENMRKLLHMCGYSSVVQIDNGYEDRGEFDAATKDFADYMGFNILQADQSFIDHGPAERIYAESKRSLDAAR